jgi:hypothetical protein
MADKTIEIMKMVMKTAAKIAVERPDLQIDPSLPLLREKHPEWFDEMRLSDLELGNMRGVTSIENIWIDGVHYELADDGDTLVKTPESDEQKTERRRLAKE